MSAAKRTLLAAVSVALLGAVTLAGAAGGAPPDKRDRVPPTPPQNVHVVAATPLAVATAWDPSQDDVGVAGYYVYHDTGRAKVSIPAYTVGGLDCGYSTAISVAAFDQSGNRSARVAATVATAACPDVQSPTAPSGFSQAATTQHEVVLTWAPSSDDVGVVGYGVYRNVALISSPAEPTVTLSGLACGTTYMYAVDAADAAGNRSLLGTVYVQTASCSDGQPPSAPAGLAVTATTQTSVSVGWSPSSDDVGVAGYHVRKAGTLVATGTQTSATVSGLACGATATISVDAFDAAGNQSPQSSTSATADACTPPPPPPTDTTPPSQPSGLAVSATSPTSVSLGWAASSDDVGVSGYGVYVNGSSVSSVTQLAATVSNLTCATTYTLAVDAYDAAGNRSSRATLSAASASCSAPPPPPPPPDTTPPSTPQNQAISGATQTSFLMSWSPATDNVAVTGYNVYLGGVKLATVTTTSYTYTGLTCATTYTVALEARDAAGNVSNSAYATGPASTLACNTPPPPPPPSSDTTPPSTPPNLGISGSTRASVTLTWAQSTDNVGVTGYRTYVNGSAGSSSVQPGATVSNLTCGTAYTFEVDAYDAAGNRSPRASLVGSTVACADTLPPTAPANVVATSRTATSIAISWSASSDNVGVIGYGLYRGGAQTGTTAATNGIFSSLTCNTNYTLAVDASDAAANRSTQTVVMVSTTACPDASPPSTPTGLAASNISQTALTLTWNASSDNVGVTGYDTYRNGTKMATVTSASSSQTGLACGTSYPFAVIARDAAGNFSQQAQLNVATAACSTPPPPPPATTLPCGSSLDAAYDAAASGALIELSNCSYSGKSITGSKSSPVIFDLNGSDQGSIAIFSNGIELRDGIVSPYWDSNGPAPSNVTLRNIHASGIYWDGGTNIQWLGGELGPQASDQINWIFSDRSAPISNVLIDGVYVHDNSCVSSGCHYEAIRIDHNANNITIRNSTFKNNAIFHIFLTTSGAPPTDVTIENNVFDQPLGGSSVIAIHDPVLTSLDPATLRYIVRNNVAAVGSNFRGPFWVFTGNTFG